MVTTTVINKSGSVMEIEEGNAGVWSKLATVAHNASFILKTNPNTTYREYDLFNVIVEPPGSTTTRRKVKITSDDCLDASEIKILFDPKTKELKVEVEKHSRQGLTDGHIVGWYESAKRLVRGIFRQRDPQDVPS